MSPTADLSAFSGETDPKYSDRKYYGLFSLDELYVTYYYKEGDVILQEKVCGGEGVSYTEKQLTEDDRLMKLFSEAYLGGKVKYFPER